MKAVPGSPIEGMDAPHDFDFEWAADSESLIVYAEPRILRLDAVGSASPTVISADAVPTGRLGPSGLIPYQPSSIAEDAVVEPRDRWGRAEGADPQERRHLGRRRSLVRALLAGRIDAGVHPELLPDHAEQLRIFVANADGTGAHRLTNVTGLGDEADFAWSPDSKQIAFNRWVPVDPAKLDGAWEPQPIGIAIVDGGGAGSSVFAAGPSQGSVGADFEWAPDGSALIAIPTRPDQAVTLTKPTIIDVDTGDARVLDVTTNAMASWQRLAP